MLSMKGDSDPDADAKRFTFWIKGLGIQCSKDQEKANLESSF